MPFGGVRQSSLGREVGADGIRGVHPASGLRPPVAAVDKRRGLPGFRFSSQECGAAVRRVRGGSGVHARPEVCGGAAAGTPRRGPASAGRRPCAPVKRSCVAHRPTRSSLSHHEGCETRRACSGRHERSAHLHMAARSVRNYSGAAVGRAARSPADPAETFHNLRRLNTEPRRVLGASLFWLDDPRWWPHVPIFVAVVAPAERRLRWWRWLLVGIAAHVIGTYVGQTYLRRSIRRAKAPRRLVNARDVGVSYFVLGVAGAASGYVEPPWRSRCQLGALAALTGNAALRPTFTEVGHLTAFVVGVAALPLAPDR